MKVYKLEVMVIDQDINTIEEAKSLFNIKFPNWANVQVITCRESDIGEWGDDNLLNGEDTQEEEMNRLFPVNKNQVVDLKNK